MRNIPESFAARLGGASTICHCWRLRLRDGDVMGFTDHDEDVVVEGLVHSAGSGLSASEAHQQLGFGASGCMLAGALDISSLRAEDVLSGRYDGGRIECRLVDWRAPDNSLLVDAFEIASLRRTQHGFSAVLTGVAQRFHEATGRLYQAGCDAEFADARCGLEGAHFTLAAQVASSDGDLVLRIVSTSKAEGWFANGVLARSDLTRLRIRSHFVGTKQDELVLWAPPARPFEMGEAIQLTAGCDKTLATCRDRFANVVNFRGFPHVPSPEMVLAYAHASDVTMDGGSLFR